MTDTVLQAIREVLEGFRRDHCTAEKAVEFLESLFRKQSPDAQPRFFDSLQSELLSESFSHLQSSRDAHTVIIRACATFGPADRLPGLVFGLLRYDDEQGMESWARLIAPEFVHSLYVNRERFSPAALDLIEAQAALLASEQSAALTGSHIPRSVAEIGSRLTRVVGKIRFERFEETLKSPPSPATHQDGLSGTSPSDLKLEILRLIAQSAPNHVHKYNLLGRPSAQGYLEITRGTPLSDNERNFAYQAFDELKETGHIRPTYTDLIQPENWVIVTDKGHRAIETGALDALDDVLLMIAPHLVELRRGAWAALRHGTPHSLEQAAHSARELIDQVLKIGAPDDEIKSRPWYSADETSKSGVTRRMRLKFLTDRHGSNLSETGLAVADQACGFVLAIDNKLIALSHSRSEPDQAEVESVITCAEIALKSVLFGFRQ